MLYIQLYIYVFLEETLNLKVTPSEQTGETHVLPFL